MATYIAGPLKAFASEAITIDDTAGGKALSTAEYADTTTAGTGYGSGLYKRRVKLAVVTVETQQLRWTCDGTAPTSSVGHLANVADSIILEGYDNIVAFRAIRATGSSSAVYVTYYRVP